MITMIFQHNYNVKRLKVSLALLALALAVIGFFVFYQNNQIVLQKQADFSDIKSDVVSPADLQLAQHSDQMPQNINQASAASVATVGCALGTTLTSTQKNVQLNDPISYTLVIKNQGTKPCQNVSVSAYYSDNEVFVSSIPKPNASNYYWKLGTMPSGKSAVINFSTKATENSGLIQTEICAASDSSDDSCVSLTANISNNNSAIANPTDETTAPEIIEPEEPVAPEVQTDGGSTALEYGTWIWNSPLQMSSTYIKKVLDGAAANGINTVYVTIDDYLTINSLAESAAKQAKIKAYDDALQNFISEAKLRGLSVDVEAGWRDWAESTQKYKAAAIADYVIRYNASHSEKIQSLQYDIEPYLLPSYNQNKADLLRDFVQLIDEISTRLGTNQVGLSVVIPHFYDDAQKWTPAVTYDDVTTYTFNHLLRILDSRPDSAIILMSYRNFAQGDDGTIQISNTEVTEASTGTHLTKVIVAQETGDVQPDYVTFYGTSKVEYLKQKAIIMDAFTPMKGFGGFAVHYIDPFLLLK